MARARDVKPIIPGGRQVSIEGVFDARRDLEDLLLERRVTHG